MTLFRLVPDPETARSWIEYAVWLAGAFLALVALWRSPAGTPIRFVWRRLVTEPRSEARTAEIGRAMRPLVDELRAAAKAEHEAQNVILHEHAERLDRGADAINGLREDVAELRGHLHLPRPPDARTRKDDHHP